MISNAATNSGQSVGKVYCKILYTIYGKQPLFLFAHFYSPLALKEPNYRKEITRQYNISPNLCSPDRTMHCLIC